MISNNSSTLELTSEPNPPVHYYQEHITNIIHHFYLSTDIGPATHYVEMIHAIRTAAPTDVVFIHLNSAGGHLDTGIQIINAMRESRAHIICSIESEAYSMASLIFLSADEFIVHENCMLMIHNFSSGMVGKGNEQRLRLDATSTLFERFARPLYVPFISEDEFDGVLDGKDMWFHTDEIRDRLIKNMNIANEDEMLGVLNHEEDDVEEEEVEVVKPKPKHKN